MRIVFVSFSLFWLGVSGFSIGSGAPIKELSPCSFEVGDISVRACLLNQLLRLLGPFLLKTHLLRSPYPPGMTRFASRVLS